MSSEIESTDQDPGWSQAQRDGYRQFCGLVKPHVSAIHHRRVLNAMVSAAQDFVASGIGTPDEIANHWDSFCDQANDYLPSIYSRREWLRILLEMAQLAAAILTIIFLFL